MVEMGDRAGVLEARVGLFPDVDDAHPRRHRLQLGHLDSRAIRQELGVMAACSMMP